MSTITPVGPERTSPGFLAERRDGPFDLETAYQAAEAVIAAEAIDPRKLGKPYHDIDVMADMQKVRDCKTQFAKDDERTKKARKLSKILEVAIHQQVNAGWFGRSTRAVLPSEFDDYVNKVDLITEFGVKDSPAKAHAALGIDVTYGDDLTAKIHKILEQIDKGVLSTVMYYKSPDGRFVGSLNHVPRVIVGMDEASAGIIARAWYQGNPALKTDPLREKVIIEIIDECEAFERYAIAKGRPEVAESYRYMREIFEKIYGDSVTPEDRKQFANDKVLQRIELIINQLK